ncbi:Sphingolipid delta(4)-desaturase DES1 [Rhizophlyctis rosea]|nr:Sphingolipid delta(4)-desaturase DES1 [Rhizophlyctis rosea]
MCQKPDCAHKSGIESTDRRHPLYLGDWKRSIPGVHNDIAKDDLDEPHIKRKQAILDTHPEIRTLYGVEWRTIPITIAGAATQVILAYVWGKVYPDQWLAMLLCVYVIGASLTSLFGVIIHEATHNLCHSAPWVNRVVGLIANIGIPFPIFASFRRYHLEHHAYQGVVGKDPDLPLDWEIKFIRGNLFLKLLFLFFYPMMYVVRGAAMQKRPTDWEVINAVFTISTNILVWTFCGPKGLLYLFLSLWLGYGIHPGAAHFIQEHFTFDDGQETYSYYGSLNKFFMNIGYHNEHHDFTKVPWSKLPDVRARAPEFYNTLKYHMSWTRVLVNFVLQRDIGPQSRVGRDYETHKKGRKMHVPKQEGQKAEVKKEM